MTTLQIKNDVHQLIDFVEDVEILKAIKLILQKQLPKEVDFWDMLPSEVKISIEKGIEQAEKGELIAHETVMAEIKKKYDLK